MIARLQCSMKVNEHDFISNFYNEFLALKAEVSLLRTLVINLMAVGDKEKLAKINEMVDEEILKLYKTIAEDATYQDESKKLMVEEIKRRF